MIQQLNLADLVILAIIGFSLIHGLARGFVRAVLFLATLAVAVVALWLYNDDLAGLMAGFIERPELRLAISFLVLFFGVMVIGNWLLANILTSVVSLAGLNFIDRMLGGIFGLAWGALLIYAILFVTGLFLSDTNIWRESALIPYVLALMDWFADFFTRFDAPDVI